MNALRHISRTALRAYAALALGASTRREIAQKWQTYGISDTSLDAALHALRDLNLLHETAGRAASRGACGVASTFEPLAKLDKELAEFVLKSNDSLAQLRKKIGAVQKNWGAAEKMGEPQIVRSTSDAQEQTALKAVLNNKKEQQTAVSVDFLELKQNLIARGVAPAVATDLVEKNAAECELQLKRIEANAAPGKIVSAIRGRWRDAKPSRQNTAAPAPFAFADRVFASEETRKAGLDALANLQREFQSTIN